MRSLPVFAPGALEEWEPAAPASTSNAWTRGFDRDGTLLWLAGRGGGTGYLWGVELRPRQDAVASVTWLRPADTGRLILELGLPQAAESGVQYRIRAGGVTVQGTFSAGDPPRTVVVDAHDAREVHLEISAGGGRLAAAHPRWTR